MTRLRTLALLLVWPAAVACAAAAHGDRWSAADLEDLRSLWIGDMPGIPADPTNRVADDPRAAALGRALFFDTRLSRTGQVACGTCHLPDRRFQDGKPLGDGVGVTDRRTMPVAGLADAPFLFWDGRKDSLWAQALGPLESPVEHGGTRAQYAHVVAAHYRGDYEAIFGPLPDLSSVPPAAGPVAHPPAAAAWRALDAPTRDAVTEVFVNIGKAIAAYERTITHEPSRFDRYVEALVTDGDAPADILDADEVAGLRLFMGKARCMQCHNGPSFTNHDFHNTDVPAAPSLPEDHGRLAGATAVLGDEFNCRSRWSDAPRACPELDHLVTGEPFQARAFKVPSLRGVATRAPYMHAGQFATLAEVIDHYNRAPRAPAGHTELVPLRLSARERRQLEAFLRTLDGGVHDGTSMAAGTRGVTARAAYQGGSVLYR